MLRGTLEQEREANASVLRQLELNKAEEIARAVKDSEVAAVEEAAAVARMVRV